METSHIHVYSTKLPATSVAAMQLLGIPIPLKYEFRTPISLEFWLPRKGGFSEKNRIRSRPWDSNEEIHWESEQELSQDDIESLRLTWEAPHLRSCDFALATAIVDLQGKLREHHNGLAKRLEEGGTRVHVHIRELETRIGALEDTEKEHYGDHGLSIGDLEEKVGEIERRIKHLPEIEPPRDQKVGKRGRR